MRAWKSLGGRGGGGGSALRLASLFTCGANSARTSLPHADSGARRASLSSAVSPALRASSLAGAPIAAMRGRAAKRLQSEWAAEIYWGARGDASVIGDLLAGAGRPTAVGSGGGEHGGRARKRGTREMRVLMSEKFWVNYILKSQKGATCSPETRSN